MHHRQHHHGCIKNAASERMHAACRTGAHRHKCEGIKNPEHPEFRKSDFPECRTSGCPKFRNYGTANSQKNRGLYLARADALRYQKLNDRSEKDCYTATPWLQMSGNTKIGKSGCPQIQISGTSEIWKSRYPDFGNPEIRISETQDIRISENPFFRKP